MAIALDPRFVIELQPSRRVADAAVYRRRRLVVLLVFVGLAASILVGGRAVLADRGGHPAPAPTVSPAQAAAASPATYVVRPGDSLWSIAERFAANQSVVSYVDDLVAANHGPSIRIGEVIVLPG